MYGLKKNRKGKVLKKGFKFRKGGKVVKAKGPKRKAPKRKAPRRRRR